MHATSKRTGAALIVPAVLIGMSACACQTERARDLGPQPCAAHEECLSEERCIDAKCLANPPACGADPNPNCAKDLDEAACASNDGTWRCSSDNPQNCACDCAAGDRGCPCWKATHCEGACTGDNDDCIATTLGTCSATRILPAGCHCALFGDQFSNYCVD